jgi:hypothetical protein
MLGENWPDKLQVNVGHYWSDPFPEAHKLILGTIALRLDRRSYLPILPALTTGSTLIFHRLPVDQS